MTLTAHLSLPLLAAAQAQKHVTHNEALTLLDALVHLSVKERRTAPPAAPEEGERHLVEAGAGGAFAGQAGKVALFDLGAWRFLAPRPGWRAYVESERALLVHNGTQWRALADIDRPGPGNLLVNAEGAVNQRGFAGGPLAEGAYGFDRWKGGPGGCTLIRAADGTFTLAGALTQVIEDPGLAGARVCLSVENPTAPLAVSVAGVAGTIPAGAGRRHVALDLPPGASGHVAVIVTAGSATGFARPMLHVGSLPAPFERPHPAATLALCQRTYAKTFPLEIAPAGNAGLAGALITHALIANAIPPLRWQFPVPMRAVPALAFHNPSAANGQWSVGGTDAVVSATVPASRDAACIAAAATPTIAARAMTAIHVTAEAEL